MTIMQTLDKFNKAAGVDSVVTELFKVSEEENARCLKGLFDKIWQQEKVPDEWLKAT